MKLLMSVGAGVAAGTVLSLFLLFGWLWNTAEYREVR